MLKSSDNDSYPQPDPYQYNTQPDTSQPSTQTDPSQANTQPDTSQPSTQTDPSQANAQPDTSQPSTQTDPSQANTQPDTSQPSTQPDTSQSNTQPDSSQPNTQPDGSANKQDNGKYPAAPTALAQTEITNAVKKIGIPDTWPGLYFDVFQGLWKTKFANGVSVEHRVAIKSFRTAGFNSNLNVVTPERDKFEEALNDFILKWRGLDHENLAHFLGISMAYGPFPAIITTWMSKGVLTDYIKPENANTHNKLQLVINIGRGIKYLHEQGIIHSDIRVASCLVNESGEAVLADPGLLNVLKKSPVLARGSTETYPWMAPELFDRPPKDLSQKTDVYAFTMASWEIYSGEEPFAGLQVHEVIFEIQQNSRPEQPSGVKSELWTLWGNGWNKDEATRPLMASYVSSLEKI